MILDRCSVPKAAFDSVSDDGVHIRMQSEWGCDKPFDVGMILSSLSHERGNIVGPVPTGRQEIGKYDDPLRTALNAAIEGCGD